MTRRFDLYGCSNIALDDVAGLAGDVLQVVFELHDSSYRGGDYFLWRGTNGEEIILQRNFEDDEGYLSEPDNPSFSVLLYASGLGEAGYELLAGIDGVRLLRTELL